MSAATEFWTREMFEDAGVDPDTLEPVPGGPADWFERILAREAPQMAAMTPATSATITIGDRTIEATDVTFDAEPALTGELDKIPTRTATIGAFVTEMTRHVGTYSNAGKPAPVKATRPPNRKERRAVKARRRSA